MNEKEHEALRRAEAAAGEEAARIIENPRFVGGVESVRETILRAFADCPLGEEGNQRRLFCQASLRTLDLQVKALRKAMGGGNLAAEDVVVLADERKKARK